MSNKKRDSIATLGCLTTLIGIGIVLPILLGLIASLGSEIQWLMFKPYIVIFPLAIACLIIGFWEPSFGGILLILTGCTTIIGTFVDNLITFELEIIVFLLIPLEVLIGSALVILGIVFIKYVPRELKR